MPDSAPRIRIGIDVGGTNTDAVAVSHEGRVIVATKTPTTPDITSGIHAALETVLKDVEPQTVSAVMLGTTQATNAVVERRSLGRVAVVRIGSSVSDAVPPLTAWPAELYRHVVAGVTTVAGGHLLDGYRVAPLDSCALTAFFAALSGSVDAVAITGVFSPMYPDDELAAADIARNVLGDDIRISLGHTVGQLGLLERENATVLNAALGRVAEGIVSGMRDAMHRHGLTVPPYLAQNDGTVMDAATAVEFPILTIGSGPANSLRGAALLSGVEDAIVVDVGGTTSDLGVLSSGFGRESSQGSAIGGVQTNFPMPDIISLGFGGGTVIRRDGVGPDSVGHLLHQRALSFGGDTATITDAAISEGRMTAPPCAQPPPRTAMLQHALAEFDEALADAIDALGIRRHALPVIAVGGGNALVPDTLSGGNAVVRVEHGDVANATGAASALIGATVETIAPLSHRGKVLDETKDRAVAKAVAAGADPRLTHPVVVHETDLAYVAEPSVRLRVKAAGPIAPAASR